MVQKQFQDEGARLVLQNNECSVWRFQNKTGEGTMTLYEVMPGVLLSYNDFHLGYYQSAFHTKDELFVIDHCRERRMEYQAALNSYGYVEANDIKFDRRIAHTGEFVLPLEHYHGLTICFDIKMATKSLQEEMKDFPVAIKSISQKFCSGEYPWVIHDMKQMAHFFEELYQVPEKIRLPYIKIKIYELLLYLEALEMPDGEEKRPYFYKTQVEKIKAVQDFQKKHIAEDFTQEELAERFDISLTTMKRCYKSVYGCSMGIWLNQYRMNKAANMLKNEKELSVSEIAGRVGYDNASKFAMAFKKMMGMTPLVYRHFISERRLENE